MEPMTDPPRGVTADEYLDPSLPGGLRVRDLPVVDVDDPAVRGLAVSVSGDPRRATIPIVPWPVAGRRPLDPDTGTGGGVVEGRFRCTWADGRLMATNEAVGGRYVIGFAHPPDEGGGAAFADPPDQVLLWHLNHHPDGGQLFASLDGRPFLVPAAPPGEDPDLDRAVAIRSDGSVAVCLLPGVWHDGVYPEHGDGEFLTRQGAVHARVSASVAEEHGVLLRVTLSPSGAP